MSLFDDFKKSLGIQSTEFDTELMEVLTGNLTELENQRKKGGMETIQPKFREVIKGFWVNRYKKGKLPRISSSIVSDRSHYNKAVRQLELSDYIRIYQSSGFLYAEKGEFKKDKILTKSEEKLIKGFKGTKYEGHEYYKGDKIKCNSMSDLYRVALVFTTEGYRVGINEYSDLNDFILTITAPKIETEAADLNDKA